MYWGNFFSLLPFNLFISLYLILNFWSERVTKYTWKSHLILFGDNCARFYFKKLYWRKSFFQFLCVSSSKFPSSCLFVLHTWCHYTVAELVVAKVYSIMLYLKIYAPLHYKNSPFWKIWPNSIYVMLKDHVEWIGKSVNEIEKMYEGEF